MTQGIEVLQAALAGKQVRPTYSAWRHWDPNCHYLVDFYGEVMQTTIRDLWELEWEIEPDAPMTFTDAVRAMDAGRIVQRDGELYRKHPTKPDEYQWAVRYAGQFLAAEHWDGEAVFDGGDFRATDWQIVEEGPVLQKESKDQRLTYQEAIGLLKGAFLAEKWGAWGMARPDEDLVKVLHALSRESNASWFASWVIALFRFHSPTMFRGEEE